MKKIYVVTNKVQKDKIEEELPFIPKENIIAELMEKILLLA
jgi:hypothetical protein